MVKYTSGIIPIHRSFSSNEPLNPLSCMIFEYEGLRSHTPLKGLAMAPLTPLQCLYRLRDSPLNKLSSDL